VATDGGVEHADAPSAVDIFRRFLVQARSIIAGLDDEAPRPP
jgi:hypothetical protein